MDLNLFAFMRMFDFRAAVEAVVSRNPLNCSGRDSTSSIESDVSPGVINTSEIFLMPTLRPLLRLPEKSILKSAVSIRVQSDRGRYKMRLKGTLLIETSPHRL